MSGVRWCQSCQDQTPRINPPICILCGQTTKVSGLCKRCSTTKPHFAATRSWAEFRGPIRNALHDIKYRKNLGLGGALALHLAQILDKNLWEIDLVAPVPLGEEREKQRGYNQADLLARPLASYLQLPYNPRILNRIRETVSQVELDLTERQKNVMDAFQANRDLIQGLKILIIDDVTTSGSTLNACAKTLVKNGAKAVYGLTVARAVLSDRA